MRRFAANIQPGRTGLTLVELMMSSAIMSLLTAGLASSVLVTARAIPTGNNAASVTVNSGQALSELEADVTSAKTIISNSPRMIEFTVSDRTGDNVDETIRYEWSGVAGNALTRRFNGGTVTTIQSNVGSFNISYFKRPVITMIPQTDMATVGPSLLASFVGYSSGSPVTRDFSIAGSGASGSTNGIAGEYFYLTNFPANVKQIQFTQARVWLKSYAGSTTDPQIAIYTARGKTTPKPSSNSIGTPVTIPRSSLTSAYTQVTVNFPANVKTPTVSQDFVLLLTGPSSTPSASLKHLYLSSGAPADNAKMKWSTDEGSTWMADSADMDKYDVPFEIWGTYETATTIQVPVTNYHLQCVDISLIAGNTPAPRLDVTVLAPGYPEIAGP